MARPSPDSSIEELLKQQRAAVLKCMQDAKQCLAFNETLFKKVMQESAGSPAGSPEKQTLGSLDEDGPWQRQCSEPAASLSKDKFKDDLKIPLLRQRTSCHPGDTGLLQKGGKAEKDAKRTASKEKTMFGSPAPAMDVRDRVVQALKQKVYNVEDLYKEEGWAQAVAKSNNFQNLTLLVIACNTIWMAVETDYNKAVVLCDAPWVFIIVDNLFTLYFMFEVFVRFCSFQKKRDALRDGWFKFDFALVCLMVWETYIFVGIYLLLGGGINSGGLKRLAIFRLFRLLRLTRVARMARLLRACPELLVLAKAMVMALRSLGATLTLLMLVIYVFSIMFTQLLCEEKIGVGYFETIPQTFNTLLMFGAFTEQREFFAHMLKGGFIYYLLFMAFILVGSYTVLNMLIGVICEVISDVANREREDIMIADLRVKIGKISSLFASEAEDGDLEAEPMISKENFISLMENESATHALNEVGVDVIALVELADFIFPKDKDGKVGLSRFLQLMLQFRGSNTATVKDIVDMRKYFLSELHEMEDRMLVQVPDQ